MKSGLDPPSSGAAGELQAVARRQSSLRRLARMGLVMVRLLVLAVLIGLPAIAVAQEIRYLYDDLNRLVGVIDQQGNAARVERVVRQRRIRGTGPT